MSPHETFAARSVGAAPKFVGCARHAPDGILTVTREGVIEFVSTAVAKLFGYAREELIGQDVSILVPPEAEGWNDPRALLCGSPGLGREVLGMRRDGEVFSLYLSMGEGHDPRMVTGIVFDLTEEKRRQARRDALTEELLGAWREAGKAEVATSVLHNVGNVLNTINISASVAGKRLRGLAWEGLAKAIRLMREHPDLISRDQRGKRLIDYLDALAIRLGDERSAILDELDLLASNVDHVMSLICVQQQNARRAGKTQRTPLRLVADEVLLMQRSALEKYGIQVDREYAPVPDVVVDSQRLLQLLNNLVSNAKHAMSGESGVGRRLILRIARSPNRPETQLRIEVIDNGVGIARENLARIFSYGFTTRKYGHGFGLHSAAIAAREMGAVLRAESDGPGRGARFSLDLPISPQENDS